MSTRTMITAAALMALMAGPAAAQQHHQGQDSGMGMMVACPMMGAMHGSMMGGMHGQDMEAMHGQMMESGMMGAMHTSPSMLLQATETLQLTPRQTEQLTALGDRVREEHQEHMQAATTAHRSAAAALEGEAPDLGAYAEALNQAADHMVMAHVAMTRVSLEAKALLTPGQLEKLDEVMRAGHGMHGMMQGGHESPGAGGSGSTHGGHR